jgi:hypothetical protein
MQCRLSTDQHRRRPTMALTALVLVGVVATTDVRRGHSRLNGATGPKDVPVVFSSYISDGGNATCVQVLGSLGVVAVGGFVPVDQSFGGHVLTTVLSNGTTGAIVFIDAAGKTPSVVAVTRIGEVCRMGCMLHKFHYSLHLQDRAASALSLGDCATPCCLSHIGNLETAPSSLHASRCALNDVTACLRLCLDAHDLFLPACPVRQPIHPN